MKILVVILIIVIGGTSYWFGVRPSQAKKTCHAQARTEADNVQKAENDMVLNGFPLTKRADYEKIYQDNYQECIRIKGL